MQYYLFAVAKNNKKQINTILSYHDKFSKFVSESDAKKYQEIASEMYFYFPHVDVQYYYPQSVSKLKILTYFFKSVSKNGKIIFDKISKEQDINFFINQSHNHHHYSLKEALVAYALTYEKPAFKKICIIIEDIWKLLSDEKYPINYSIIQHQLPAERVRLYNFQNFPLPKKNKFIEPVELTIFKVNYTTTYENAIFWNEFLIGIQEIFQIRTTNRTPNHKEVQNLLDFLKSYYGNEFIKNILPFFIKEKSKNARTETNKILWQSSLLELTIEDKPSTHKVRKI